MSWKMRKSLLEHNKFRHFVPQRRISEVDETLEAVIDYDETTSPNENKESENIVNEVDVVKANSKIENSLRSQSDEANASQSVDKSNTRVEPVVTVLNVSAIKDSRSQLDITQRNGITLGNQSFSSREYRPCQKSPNLSNKTYSLINLGTGLTKSKFTLELEDKLRQSKFDLGFDADINDWKEFTYKMESPEFKRRSEGIPKIKLPGEENHVGRGLEKVYLKDPLQYCNHDCQVLGLCSVRPNIFRKKEIIEEPHLVSVNQYLTDADKCFNDDKETHKKDMCNCQHCTLAFLTEMQFPEHADGDKTCITVKRSRNRSIDTMKSKRSSYKEKKKLPLNLSSRTLNSQRSSNLERIKIRKVGKFTQSIEVSVKGRSERSSTVRSLTSESGLSVSQSNMSSECSEDCTNKKIRQIFRNNDKSPVKHTDTNPTKTASEEIPFVSIPVEEKPSLTHFLNCSPERTMQVRMADLRQSAVFKKCKAHKKSSASTVGASVSSSLSTIMSYKRVRQLFQTIIERNRARRRPRKNINKTFKEMEELGLGEVKNNRWYPSDSKTYTIWNDLHQNVRGAQAEFKRFPKASSREAS